ncbi:hypothetical protein J5069_00795 [Candidatus Symbiopectobacterium sp. NZEC127]|uniref:hypothetical protein n=1 Tax=Candidatus Symbiopectobacterium sp. NZEC127 TaxID=2820472 RepID=UPI002226E898|nr:hypothetical protein [Candidatus Symbiopectobacterium sp. NZEC127]MCW2484426.1 hypothetical protein [Candidatus Symbiopectobacterium sp. NZEC127]
MTYREMLSQHVIAISISDSPDMPVLGLSEQHLYDAMTEIARHLLALGARIVYGGDLRVNGFTELLFELVARHRRDADEGDERPSILNYLAWPVHMQKDVSDLEKFSADLIGMAKLVLFNRDGELLPMAERAHYTAAMPSDDDWAKGLTAMRQAMLQGTHARIILGGRVDKYKGAMPGIAEEALLSLHAKQPLFIMGGFGGCAKDITESLNIVASDGMSQRNWVGREEFVGFSFQDLNNGLTEDENFVLAQTPHVDQAITMILRGFFRLEKSG